MTQVERFNSITGLLYSNDVDIKDTLFLSNKNSIMQHSLNNLISKKIE